MGTLACFLFLIPIILATGKQVKNLDLVFGDEARNGRRLYLIAFIFFVEWEANSVPRGRGKIKKSIQV